MKNRHFLFMMAIVIAAVWCSILTYGTPADDDRAIAQHEEQLHCRFPIFTTEYQLYYHDTEYFTLELGITEKEYDESRETHLFRGNPRLREYNSFLTPNAPYIIRIADILTEKINAQPYEYTDLQVAYAALLFVRTATDYSYDIDLYGTNQYVAFPMETLYSGLGDCEDLSILYASIMIHLGYDTVLVHLPDHVAVGVDVGEQKYHWMYEGYTLFECTANPNDPIWLKGTSGIEIFRGTGWYDYVGKWNEPIRYWIHRIFRI